MTPALSARALAAKVLLRVEQEGSFAAAALSSTLDGEPSLSAADRALATELTYGALRVRLGLLRELDQLLHQGGAAALDPLARAHLMLGLYQLLFLDRVPAFAATNEAVKLVSHARSARLGGLVNALLRRAVRELLPQREQAITRVAWASMPEWLRAALTRSLGKKGARAFAADALKQPSSALMVKAPAQRDALLEELTQRCPDATFTRSEWSRHGLRVEGSARFGELPGHGTLFCVQEEGSQAIALALDVQPGERVLDTCAGRGQKTVLLGQALAGQGELVATDLHESKLSELCVRFAGFDLAAPTCHAVDWTLGPGEARGPFDAILVDAPCTGIGTLRRRPDLLLRRTPEDLERLPALQAQILGHALAELAPGGRLLYATCSVLHEEGPELVARVLSAHPEVTWVHGARLLPHVHGTDGYFFALLVKDNPVHGAA